MGLEEIVRKEYVENDPTLCFKSTPVFKVIILSILSFGLYPCILSYSYWNTLKKNFGYKVSPLCRGFLFSPIFNFSLFPLLNKYFKNFNSKLPAPIFLAIVLILSFFIANGVFTFISIIISTIILSIIQNKMNKVNEVYYPDAPQNPWGIANTLVTVLILIPYFSLICYGMYTIATSSQGQ